MSATARREMRAFFAVATPIFMIVSVRFATLLQSRVHVLSKNYTVRIFRKELLNVQSSASGATHRVDVGGNLCRSGGA
jgi:hypothetical protein